ncbi:MAG: pantoate kinase [Infirmifilum sp.]|uniref:pantoate kinase n=1 Tax=Infirmifilum sp. TaxID=2856575 RepID=UPI003D107577
MRCIKAWSPAGLSAIFEAVVVEGDPMRSGARGAGLALEKGVMVEVCLSEEGVYETYLNDIRGDYIVARMAAEEVAKQAKYTGGFIIKQWVEVPIGGGLGTSGASSLAVALAASRLLDLKITYTSIARIAHKVEVLAGTGLGTISGLALGGACIVLEPGPPGYDKVERIPIGQDYVAVVGFFGPIKKSTVLRSTSLNEINRLGRRLVEELAREPTVEKMLDISKKFSIETRLATEKVARAYQVLEDQGFPHAGQAMVGDTVFTVVPEDKADKVVEILERLNARVITSRISWKPAVLLTS